jgi:hypothetical protein
VNYVGTPPAPAGVVLVGDTNPVGVMAFFHAPPDASWLQLNGQTVLKASYPDLWSWAQGFLTADQATFPGLYRNVDANNFAVPNLDGLFIRAAGGTVALSVGARQGSAFGSHAHPVNDPTHVHAPLTQNYFMIGPLGGGSFTGPGGGQYASGDTTKAAATGITIGNTGDPNETRPANVAFVACVKAKKTALVLMPAIAAFAKAWVRFDVAGGVATIKRGYNVTSVVRGSVGQFTVTFTTPFVDAFYAPIGSSSGALVDFTSISADGRSINLRTYTDTGAFIDPPSASGVFFGDV